MEPENVEVVNVTIEDNRPMVIESFCTQCQEQGETRMMLTSIPFFKDIIVMSFSCDHCGFKNNEIQNRGQLEEYGVKVTLKVTKKEDLQRNVVRGEFATTFIPEAELEIPTSRKGYMSTVEGFLTTIKEDLGLAQPQRHKEYPEVAVKIDSIIDKLDRFITGEELEFQFILNDPAGNSFIENPLAPSTDNFLKYEKFTRTRDQLEAMGYSAENVEQHIIKREEQQTEAKKMFSEIQTDMINKTRQENHKYTKEETNQLIENVEKAKKKFEVAKTIDAHKVDFTKPLEKNDVEDESIQFEVECHNCGLTGYLRMCTCTIPYFKEIIIMAFTCEACGARSTDIKTGGDMAQKARKLTFHVKKSEDFDRDIFKSETASIEIPEIGLELTSGSLGGFYSTIEGLIAKMLDVLKNENPFVGDSQDVEQRQNFEDFLIKLEGLNTREHNFTVIFDDPLDNCFILNPNYPNEDPNLDIEIYPRTHEQNEELGINDMVLDGYMDQDKENTDK